MVAFAEVGFAARPLDPAELGVPGLEDARDLLAAAAPLFTPDPHAAMLAFEMPSNPVFQPPEYRSTNCCAGAACETCSPSGYCMPGHPPVGGDNCGGVTAITAPSPDPAPMDTGNLTAGTQTALACLTQAVNTNGGTFALISAYRSPTYQAHLREVWDKYQTVSDWPEDRCPEVRNNVLGEWDLHQLGFRPATTSRHSSGRAFDASWGTLDAGVHIDDLAGGCGLSRPVPGDRYHFEH